MHIEPDSHNPNEPTLTCSEVVERLRKCVATFRHPSGEQALTYATFDTEKATAILHSWRERRVQELEEAMLTAAIHLGNFANEKNWSDEAGCLQWIAKRHAIEFAKEAQAEAEKALAKSEQIRKGAKHE